MQNNSSKKYILEKLRSAPKYGNAFEQKTVADQSNPFIVEQEQLVNTFKEALEKINGICFLVDSIDEASLRVQNIAENKNCSKIYTTASVAKKLGQLQLPVSIGDAPRNENPVSVSECECLSARTGSVAVSSRTSNGRQLHAFAETHIIIAHKNQLFPDLPEAMKFLKEKYSGSLPSAITFITGQSRTADIEKTLILGAHGPKELIVILVK